MGDTTCSEPDCDRRLFARGLCQNDYNKRRWAGTLSSAPYSPSRHALSDVDLELMTATCDTCGPDARVKYRRKKNLKDGELARYLTCARGKRKIPFGARPQVSTAADKGDARARLWRSRFNIGRSEYETILATQGGRCAICDRRPGTGQVLSIDHDHSCCPERHRSCGRCIRGLLCRSCNVGLGHFKDRADLLERAQAYLTV
jgi:hypothetical protein